MAFQSHVTGFRLDAKQVQLQNSRRSVGLSKFSLARSLTAMLRRLLSPPSVIIPGRDISKMSLAREIVTKLLNFTAAAIIERENITRKGHDILRSFQKAQHSTLHAILRTNRRLSRPNLVLSCIEHLHTPARAKGTREQKQ
jgi:hypothetical protein